MALTFPTTPSVNDEYTIGNVTYIWDGYSWNSKSSKSYTEATVAPTSPTISDEWLSTVNGVLYKYISDGVDSYWVAISGNGVVTGGGSTVYIETKTITATTALQEFAFDGTYDYYEIRFKCTMDTTNYIVGQLRDNGTYIVANYHYGYEGNGTGGSSVTSANLLFNLGFGTTDFSANGTIYLSNFGTTTSPTVRSVHTVDSDSQMRTSISSGSLGTATLTNGDGFKIYLTSGNFSTATFDVYGITNT